MSGATDTVRDNTLDEAMFRSWNKQKKEYQDEIRRLRNKVSGYRLKLDAVQKQVISGEIRWRGRNKMNKQSFDRYQHSNGDIVSSFCKNRMFPQYKFLQPSYVMFSLENPRSLCRKINELIERPPSITSEIDEEFYWVNFTVPMINKKYCEIRSNFNTEVKKKYIGE
jgi:hypothetical protein